MVCVGRGCGLPGMDEVDPPPPHTHLDGLPDEEGDVLRVLTLKVGVDVQRSHQVQVGVLDVAAELVWGVDVQRKVKMWTTV